MGSRPALLAFAPRPRLSAGAGSVRSSMPLGFSLGRPLTPLSVATSAFSPAITCRRASFSASSRSARASSSPRGRPERLICFEADMAETGRVRADPAQPRQLTSARPFAPRTVDTRRPLLVMIGAWNVAIFQQPMWVAKYLHGLKEGQQVALREYRNQLE